jgi:hypothetical protein
MFGIGVAGRLAMFLRFLMLLASFPVFVRHVDQLEVNLKNFLILSKNKHGKDPGI